MPSEIDLNALVAAFGDAVVVCDASGAIDWYERALPRLEDDVVADELRSVIALLRPQLTLAPTATARAERTR